MKSYVQDGNRDVILRPPAARWCIWISVCRLPDSSPSAFDASVQIRLVS